jgi:serine/threonine-protein kinase
MAGGPATPASDVYSATATFYECVTGRRPFDGKTAEQLLHQHRIKPVPLEPVPEPLRPLVAAGMAKDPWNRPTDGTTLVAELDTIASGAYGRDWRDRGRSHLGEAALLLAALWPSDPPPAVQGTAVHWIFLGRYLRGRRISTVNAVIAAGMVAALVAAGTALAATSRSSHRTNAATHPAPVHSVSLQPAATLLPPSSPSPSPSPWPSSIAATFTQPVPGPVSSSPAFSPSPSPSKKKPSPSPSPSKTSPSPSPSPSTSSTPPPPPPPSPRPSRSPSPSPSPSTSSPPPPG